MFAVKKQRENFSKIIRAGNQDFPPKNKRPEKGSGNQKMNDYWTKKIDPPKGRLFFRRRKSQITAQRQHRKNKKDDRRQMGIRPRMGLSVFMNFHKTPLGRVSRNSDLSKNCLWKRSVFEHQTDFPLGSRDADLGKKPAKRIQPGLLTFHFQSQGKLRRRRRPGNLFDRNNAAFTDSRPDD